MGGKILSQAPRLLGGQGLHASPRGLELLRAAEVHPDKKPENLREWWTKEFQKLHDSYEYRQDFLRKLGGNGFVQLSKQPLPRWWPMTVQPSHDASHEQREVRDGAGGSSP